MASNHDVDTKRTNETSEYTVLVVGYAGVGKSAFCNFFTRTKLFNEFEGFFGEGSNEINKQQCDVLGTKLTLIDCPGFGDTEKTIDEYCAELGTYLTQHHVSIDIIILVINLKKRFSQEESELFLKMSKTMGHFWEKTFCVFTHDATLEKHFQKERTESSTKFGYIKLIKNSPKASQKLKDLLSIIQDRYLCIETVDKSDDKEGYWLSNVFKLFEYFKKIQENSGFLEKEKKGKKEQIGKIVKKTESDEGKLVPLKKKPENKMEEKYNAQSQENEALANRKINELETRVQELYNVIQKLNDRVQGLENREKK